MIDNRQGRKDMSQIKAVRMGQASAPKKHETAEAIATAFDAGRKAAANGFIGIPYNQYSGTHYPQLWAAWNEGNELCA